MQATQHTDHESILKRQKNRSVQCSINMALTLSSLHFHMKLAITKHVLIEYKLPQAKINFCFFGLDLDIMAMVKELGYTGEAQEVTVPISSIVHSLEGGAPSELL